MQCYGFYCKHITQTMDKNEWMKWNEVVEICIGIYDIVMNRQFVGQDVDRHGGERIDFRVCWSRRWRFTDGFKKLNKENTQSLCVIGDYFKYSLNTGMKKIKIIFKSLVLYWEKFWNSAFSAERNK